jgi:hypothetical protein
VIAVLLAVMGLRMDGTREGREPADALAEDGPSQPAPSTQTTQSTEGRDDRGSALSAGP